MFSQSNEAKSDASLLYGDHEANMFLDKLTALCITG